MTAGVLLAGSMTMAGVAMARINSCMRSYDREAAALVQQFKACPEIYKSGCTDGTVAPIIAATAEAQERSGDFLEAGMKYARLGKEKKVWAMADSLYKRRLGRLADSLIVESGIWERARRQYDETAGAKPLSSPPR